MSEVLTASIDAKKSIGLKLYEPLVVIMDDNPYTILGVTKDATDAEIKRVYRKLAILVLVFTKWELGPYDFTENKQF